MVVQLKKGRDDRPTLICVRRDGSRTWRKLHPFFPVHDMTHYAVESVFGFTEAFFGLVASGWSLETFAERGSASRLPTEALWAENMVGLFDLERASGRLMRADEFTEALNAVLAQQGVPAFRPVSDDELAAVRALRSGLQTRWFELAPAATMDLDFPGAV